MISGYSVIAAAIAEGQSLSAAIDVARVRHVLKLHMPPAWTGDRDRAIEARRMLDLDLRNTPSIAAIADVLGIGETTLRRAFKAEFGTTIFEYLRDQRLEAARVMLREKRLRISEIAFRVGYSDPANFTNAYKQRFGYAPKREI